ncbi:MAG TPA: pilus assembly protein TadG-related protein [Gemmatimonadaceae bacterium]|nr:pilus assembly protein TadG-related protein [Gemmatimonadaceae bacterium]
MSIRRGRRGAVIPLVAVMMVAGLAVLAFVVDGGAVRRHQRLLQNAADAAAFAASVELFRGRSDTEASAAAQREASRNGFANGVGGVTVTVDHPSTGSYTGAAFVRATITEDLPTTFSGLLGRSSVTIRTRAIGGTGPANTCLATLDPTAYHALDISSGGTLNAPGCSIVVNSNNAEAMYVKNNSSVVSSAVGIVGGLGGSGPISSGVVTGIPPALDPLAYLSMPTVGACSAAYGTLSPSGTVTYNPGVYCGGFDFSGPGTFITFNPGLYIIAGGGMTVRANANIRGTGVTFILTNAPSANGGATNYAGLTFASGSTEVLSAMTTGTFAGVLFYQDPSAGVSGTTYLNFIGSGAGSVFNGSMYFPTQPVQIKSGGDLNINGGLVAKTVEVITGSGNITMTGLGGGSQYSALKKPTIVQ